MEIKDYGFQEMEVADCRKGMPVEMC